MRRIHLILSGLSLIIVLLSVNRLTNITQIYLQPFEFLRVMDVVAMIPLPLFSVILYWLLRSEIVSVGPLRKITHNTFLTLVLLTGIYFFAAGSGAHEVSNYLNGRFCGAGKIQSPVCNIIGFNDDRFSHYLYYIGFVLMNVALMLLEYQIPRKTGVKIKDLLLIAGNSLFIALGIFANLAFEEARLDLFFFGGVMLLALSLLFLGKYKPKNLPVTFYFASSYTLGVVSTILYKFVSTAKIW